MPTNLAALLESMLEEPKKKCKLGTEMDRMSPETRAVLEEFLIAPKDSPKRLSHASIAYALVAEGYDISSTTIRNHRVGECNCYKTVRGANK